MRINGLGVYAQPYVYNTNMVNANSLNKVSPIEDDALKSSVDYSNTENENPLKLGETSNFADVLAMQFQLSQNNAARIMKPSEEAFNVSQIDDLDVVERTQDISMMSKNVEAQSQMSDSGATIEESEMSNQMNNSNSFIFRMNKAIEAYTVAMAC